MATKKRYYPLRSPANPTKVVLVEITEEQYQAVFPEIWAARKREQRHGRCKCPAEYSWTCNADCLDCPFHVQGDTTSLEELTEHGEEWNTHEVRPKTLPWRMILSPAARCLICLLPGFVNSTPKQITSSK